MFPTFRPAAGAANNNTSPRDGAQTTSRRPLVCPRLLQTAGLSFAPDYVQQASRLSRRPLVPQATARKLLQTASFVSPRQNRRLEEQPCRPELLLRPGKGKATKRRTSWGQYCPSEGAFPTATNRGSTQGCWPNNLAGQPLGSNVRLHLSWRSPSSNSNMCPGVVLFCLFVSDFSASRGSSNVTYPRVGTQDSSHRLLGFEQHRWFSVSPTNLSS